MIGRIGHFELSIDGFVLQIIFRQRGIDDLLRLRDTLRFFNADFGIFHGDLLFNRFLLQLLLRSQFFLYRLGDGFGIIDITHHQLDQNEWRSLQVLRQLGLNLSGDDFPFGFDFISRES